MHDEIAFVFWFSDIQAHTRVEPLFILVLAILVTVGLVEILYE